MDKKIVRSALLKQLIKDVGSNQVKSYKSGPKEEDLKEMDPKDVDGTGFENRIEKPKPEIEIEIRKPPVEIDDEDDDAAVERFLKERRERRLQKGQ